LQYHRIVENVEQAAALLRALSQDVRLRMLCTLVEREASVGDLAREMKLSQPATSQQLQALRLSGLVESRRDGLCAYYRCEDPKIKSLMDAASGIFAEM